MGKNPSCTGAAQNIDSIIVLLLLGTVNSELKVKYVYGKITMGYTHRLCGCPVVEGALCGGSLLGGGGGVGYSTNIWV